MKRGTGDASDGGGMRSRESEGALIAHLKSKVKRKTGCVRSDLEECQRARSLDKRKITQNT